MKSFVLLLAAALPVEAADKLSEKERVALVRGLSAEFATAKVMLPRSKKPLTIEADGKFDKRVWDEIVRDNGPAARVGDQVQITKVTLEHDKFLFEINGGLKTGRKWSDRIEVGMGGATSPVGNRQGAASMGTNFALKFDKENAPRTVAEVKKLLSTALDFEKHSATESYVEQLPAPVQAAIKEKRAIEGMDRDQVLMALGKPLRKQREVVEGADREDWIYGRPPGKMTFVTFEGSKVVKVKDAYAGLGGSTAPPLPVQ